MERRGALVIVLHTHLPWVLHHGRWPHGEIWLYEALAECYLPLLDILERAATRGVRPGITISLTPVLCDQLAHPDTARGFVRSLDQQIEAAERDARDFAAAHTALEAHLAQRWARAARRLRERFVAPGGRDLLARLRALAEHGAIELATSAATHAYLPLLRSDRSVRAQLQFASRSHARHFGRTPRALWLPECGYRPRGAGRPGLEEEAARAGFRSFVLDSHLITGGEPPIAYRFGRWRGHPRSVRARATGPAGRAAPGATGRSLHRAYRVANASGVVSPMSAFARDPMTSVKVWSGEEGYPSDARAREFHKRRSPGGHRYWAVTGRGVELGEKRPYDPRAAREVVEAQARDFLERVAHELAARDPGAGEPPPILCAPYDTELFGHWWFEGPAWLERVLALAHENPTLVTRTMSEALERAPAHEALVVPEGSWGAGGGHEVWWNDDTRDVWARAGAAAERVEGLCEEADRRERTTALPPAAERALAQLVRTLLLAQASDWPFLITSGQAADYARARALGHAADVEALAAVAERALAGGSHAGDAGTLASLEQRDALLPGAPWRAFAAGS